MLKSFACAAALIASAPLAASPVQQAPQSIEVPTADLDLTLPEGRKALDLRLRAAARTVCGAPNTASVLDVSARRKCRLLTMRAARKDAEILIARLATASTLAAR